MTTENKDPIPPKRNWEDCAVEVSFFITTLYCKIETPTGKVIFGKFDQDPDGRAWHLFIPLMFDANSKDRKLITAKSSEKLDNLRTSRLAAHNAKQINNFTNHEAAYVELGTTTSRDFFGVTKSCTSVGLPVADYNLFLNTMIPKDREDFIREIENNTNWKIVPATFKELDNLTKN